MEAMNCFLQCYKWITGIDRKKLNKYMIRDKFCCEKYCFCFNFVFYFSFLSPLFPVQGEWEAGGIEGD